MLRSLLLILVSALAVPGGEPIVALAHPASALKSITREKAAQILRGEMLFLDGKRLVLVLTKPSSASLPAVTFGLLQENPQAYMMRIKAAKLRGVNLDPQFMDSPDAVISSVAGNPNAVGFLAAKEAKAVGVKILPIPD
jgi:hypothetical protein